jgi:glycogen phosphorylase
MKSEKKYENNLQWFDDFRESQKYQDIEKNPIAYFCAEYALSSALPTYAGGLGILSGDMVREVGAQNFPMICIGILYQNAQSMLVDKNNKQKELDSIKELSLLKGQSGENQLIEVIIGNRSVKAQVWIWKNNNSKVYLLDTNISDNHPEDRLITSNLYIDDRQLRIKQEILLGIGGHELLNKLNITPSGFHLNEGHSAFLAISLIAEEMMIKKVSFEEALIAVRSRIFFTNHTLVLEGQEQFTYEILKENLGSYVESHGIDLGKVFELGKANDSEMFSMTDFAFRVSSKSNAVSELHAKKASILWPYDHITDAITNGIYISRWDRINNEMDIWQEHQNNKNELLEVIYGVTGQKWHEETLLFGWARRMVEYKQPLAILKNIERLKKISNKEGRQLKIVYSGPTKENASINPIIAELLDLIEKELKGIVVFLPNYNFELAKLLISGCDVWLNTPIVGREACGTSGMKAALNGVLPLSTRDGWIAEVDISNCGWTIEEPNITDKLLDITESQVIPQYYEHLSNPTDSEWHTKMKNARQLIVDKFSMTRALREYIEKLYLI